MHAYRVRARWSCASTLIPAGPALRAPSHGAARRSAKETRPFLFTFTLSKDWARST